MYTIDKPTLTEKIYQKPALKQKGSFQEGLSLSKILTEAQIKFLRHTYPEELNILSRINLKKDWIESILYTFKLFTEDPGLSRESKFLNEGGEREVIPGVSVLNRAALVHKTIEILENTNENEQKLTVLVLDIANLRQADLIKDNDGNSYADIILNKVAGEIDSLVQDFLAGNNALDRNTSVNFGRYGGDEFVLTICGNISDQEKNIIAELIKTEIGNIEGKYIDTDRKKIDIRKVNLKGGDVEKIEMPQDYPAKTIFLHFLKRGLIFDTVQIQKILNNFTDQNNILDDYKLLSYLQDQDSLYNIYPEGVLTAPDDMQTSLKADYLVLKKPELGMLVKVADLYDQKNNTKTAKGILKIVENIIFDPLLREHIVSFTQIYDGLQKKKINQLYGFDLKFIKEINDSKGLVEGDQAIVNLWQKIRPCVENSDLHKIQFGRRGGTVYVGVKVGYNLSKETIEAFDKLNNLEIFSDTGNSVQIPIGKSFMDTRNLGSDEEVFKNELKQVVDNFYESLDQDFYVKLIKIVEDLNFSEQVDDSGNSLNNLVKHFLSGKRYIERLAILRKVITDVYKDNESYKNSILAKIVDLTFS